MSRVIVAATITGDRHARPFNRPMVDSYIRLLLDLGVTDLSHGAYGYSDWGFSAIAAYAIPGLRVHPYPVLPTLDGSWPGAGPRRNRRMLRSSESEHLIRFPGNRGTADCAEAAREMGLTRWGYDDDAGVWLPLD